MIALTNKPMLSAVRELVARLKTTDCRGTLVKTEALQELRALLDKPEYPRVSIVKAHTHTCACVVGDSGLCDCGAVVDGIAVEVKPAALPDRYEDRAYCEALEQERDHLREQLKQPATQHQGEPVAWMIQWGSVIPGCRGHREVVLKDPGTLDAVITPLYEVPL